MVAVLPWWWWWHARARATANPPPAPLVVPPSHHRRSQGVRQSHRDPAQGCGSPQGRQHRRWRHGRRPAVGPPAEQCRGAAPAGRRCAEGVRPDGAGGGGSSGGRGDRSGPAVAGGAVGGGGLGVAMQGTFAPPCQQGLASPLPCLSGAELTSPPPSVCAGHPGLQPGSCEGGVRRLEGGLLLLRPVKWLG